MLFLLRSRVVVVLNLLVRLFSKKRVKVSDEKGDECENVIEYLHEPPIVNAEMNNLASETSSIPSPNFNKKAVKPLSSSSSSDCTGINLSDSVPIVENLGPLLILCKNCLKAEGP